MRRAILIALGIIISIAILSVSANAEEISSSSIEIKITTSNDYKTIEETIILQGSSEEYIEIIDFWIRDNALDVKITVDTQNLDYETSNNIYTTNLSALEIKENSQPTIKISYKLNKDEEYFQKELIRNTSSLRVTFDENILHSSTNLITGTTVNVYFYQPTATKTNLNWYLTLGIVLLLVLLIIVILYTIRKPKTTNVKKSVIESEELLSTKKSLLLSLLKDVEKQHRSKEISDETFHKLKEHYKNEAVATMKKLEDITSKVK